MLNPNAPKNVLEAYDRVDRYMQLHYRRALDSMVITDTPNYWRDTASRTHPGQMLHTCIGSKGPFVCTFHFSERSVRDKQGHFVSPSRTWRMLKQYAFKERSGLIIC